MSATHDATQSDASQRENFSRPEENTAYVRVVLARARRELGRKGTNFSDLFDESPQSEQTRAYVKTLNVIERLVLEELSVMSPEKLRALGILAD